LDELKTLRDAMERIEIEEQATLAAIAPRFQASAINLLHFIAFHRNNHPGLQLAMREAGLCSLGGCDGHLHASLSTVIGVLQKLEGLPAEPSNPSAAPSSLGGQALMQAHGERLLGGQLGEESRTRTAAIMVTLPALATEQAALIAELVEAGMDIARINCGHDGPEVWSNLVTLVRSAEAAAGRDVRIAMDLAGPKIRIGALPSQPGVVDARPLRNRYGTLLQSARILAVPMEGADVPPDRQPDVATVDLLPIRNEGWHSLTMGDRLRARDSSGRWRELTVVDRLQRGLLLSCNQRCHFTSGLEFLQEGGPGKIVVGDLPAQEGDVLLRLGDRLWLTSNGADHEVEAIKGAINCTVPEALADLKVGERVLFDEGRIAGLIREVCPGAVEVEITQARPKGNRLRADKGINFPDSRLKIPALTSRDLTDLAFAAAHADIVSYSFVSRSADIEVLQRELESHGREDLAVVLKIETRRAFLNLPRLLLTAMRYPRPLGVMIARGDLAIECGWEELAEIQEEILRICAAAHIPCIWATQVLDEMARHGMPTRAEITDAAMGARAEAVMLNKGPNITATVRTLGAIVARFHPRQPESPRHREELLSCLAFRTNSPASERQEGWAEPSHRLQIPLI
jgi:pyruvate kinase